MDLSREERLHLLLVNMLIGWAGYPDIESDVALVRAALGGPPTERFLRIKEPFDEDMLASWEGSYARPWDRDNDPG